MKTVEFRQDVNGGYRLYHASKLVPDGVYVLLTEAEAEIAALRERQPKCYACGAELDTYAKCIGCYDKLGVERDALLERERVLIKEIETSLELFGSGEFVYGINHLKSALAAKEKVSHDK